MKSMIHFLKNWTLPIAMLSGVAGYFIYVNIPFLAPTRPFVNRAVDFLQPVLIFLMLFLSFCKISLHDLRPCRWHLWLLLVQAGSFTLLGGILLLFRDMSAHTLMEGAMICLICPTATAGAVITQRLGGNAAHLATYTILINLVTAFLVPLIVPLVHPHPGLAFANAFAKCSPCCSARSSPPSSSATFCRTSTKSSSNTEGFPSTCGQWRSPLPSPSPPRASSTAKCPYGTSQPLP